VRSASVRLACTHPGKKLSSWSDCCSAPHVQHGFSFPSSNGGARALFATRASPVNALKAPTALREQHRLTLQPRSASARVVCTLGDAMSCNNLGVCYQRGSGTAKDLRRAAAQYDKVCIGLGIGCYNSAELANELPELAASSAQNFKRACERGYSLGCRKAWRRAADLKELLAFAIRGCELGDAPWGSEPGRSARQRTVEARLPAGRPLRVCALGEAGAARSLAQHPRGPRAAARGAGSEPVDSCVATTLAPLVGQTPSGDVAWCVTVTRVAVSR